MELSSAVFLGTAIAGATQLAKELWPDRVNGAVSIAVAVAVGLVVALLDTTIGLDDITVAQGVYSALSAAGVVAIAKKIG